MTADNTANKLTFRFEILKPNYTQGDSATPPLADVFRLDRTRIGNFLKPNETRFRFSQLVDIIFYYYTCVQQNEENLLNIESINSASNSKYIIPVAVAYHPNDWTDLFNGAPSGKTSIFEHIHPTFLTDLQDGQAMLLIDQSVEGYHTDWLWDWFHKKCSTYHINPQAIIYVTGDQSSRDNYDKWSADNNIDNKLNIVPSTTLSFYIYQTYTNRKLNITFDKVLSYKKENSSKIYLYDCINFRPRPQRIFNYLHLENAGLIPEGKITIGNHPEWATKITKQQLIEYHLPTDLNTTITPRSINQVRSTDSTQYYEFVERVLDDVYLNSWVSVITESSYFKHEHSVFISEKTFKPISCMQPFIIVGSKHTLKYLRKLGYKTFDGFIDESYDELDDNERFLGIVNALKKIKNIEDKVSWYNSMRKILEHNHKLFLSIQTRKSQEHESVVKYYFDYFKE
jgi:hypothetical protein